MKYSKLIRAAQILFLLIIPKKMIYADMESHLIFDGKDFLSANQCLAIKKSSIPYYVVTQDLSTQSSQIYKGSLVVMAPNSTFEDYEKEFKIIKHPQKDPIAAVGVQKIGLNFVDIASNWNIHILQTKNAIYNFNNTTLRLEKSQDKIVYRRCSVRGTNVDLPQFIIYKGSHPVGKIAFQPNAADFINIYSISRTYATKAFSPPTHQNTSPPPQTPEINTTTDQTEFPLSTTVTSPQQKVICTSSLPLRIYDDSLKNVIYKAPKYLPVKVFQDWNGGTADKSVKDFTVVRVQLNTGSGKEITGWAAASYIKPAQECDGMPVMYGGKDGEEVIPGSTVFVDSPSNCCRFPTLQPPTLEYTTGSGKRYFGARRRNGDRAHAAADLFRPQGEKVLSIDNGKVLRKYHFYAGSYALEVKHDSGYVVRYGEVDKRNIAGADSGERVVKGQHIGDISHLEMLHFEIYSDKATGPLTQKGVGKYWRRSDLLDPTPLLLKWQDMTF